MVAGGHVDGGHDICRRHAAIRDRRGSEARNLGQLDLVVAVPLGNDDGFLFRAILEARGNSDRRRIRRTTLRRKSRRFPPRIPRDLPRRFDELPHSGLGHQGDDQHHDGAAGRCDRAGTRLVGRHRRPHIFYVHTWHARAHGAADLRSAARSLHGALHVHRRPLGSAGHRPVPVHLEDDDDYRAGVGGRVENRRDDAAEIAAVARE